MTTPLQTERLTLRRPGARDWEAARDFFTSPRAVGVGGPHTPGRAFRAFLGQLGHWEFHGYGMFAVCPRGDDRAVALVGPWNPVDWPEPEVGWMVLDGAVEGTGVAREAAEAALAHAWATLGWDTAVSYIYEDNHRSRALAERLGARLDPDAVPSEGSRAARVLVYRHLRPAEAAA